MTLIRGTIVTLLVTILWACGEDDPATREGPRVVVIGLDSADWTILDPLMAQGHLPNLQGIVREGVRARLETTEPILSPIIWTTIATGRDPADHGIGWFMSDTENGEKVPVTSTVRKTKALWNILSDNERTCSVLGWWATYPAEAIQGEIVSDFFAFHNFGNSGRSIPTDLGKVWPPAYLEEIKSLLVNRNDLEHEFVRRFVDIDSDEFERTISEPFTFEDPVSHLTHILATSRSYEAIGHELLDRDRDLALLYFEGIDSVSHLFMKFAPPRLPTVSEEGHRRYAKTVREFCLWQDEILGRLLERVDDNTIVMIVSDHGFRSGDGRPPETDAIDVGKAHLWHTKHGVFAARGPGIRKGVSIPDLSIFDVTPTILYTLGLPIAEDMPGKVAVDAFEPPSLHEVRRIASYESIPRSESAPPGALAKSSVSDLVTGRLQALGYVGDSGLASSGVHINNARRLAEKGEWLRAEEELHKALRLEPANPRIQFELAKVAVAQGNTEKARERLDRALVLAPDNFSAVILRGQCAAAQGDLAAAKSDYMRACELAPDRPFPHVALGDVLHRTGHKEEAIASLERALEIDENNVTALYNLGVIYGASNRFDQATNHYERVVAIQPNHELAHNNLGNILSEKGEFKAAITHFETALRAGGETFEKLYNLGTTCLQMGQTDKALELLEKALAFDPQSQPALNNLASAFLRAGKTQKAFETYRTITQLYPSDFGAWIQSARLLVVSDHKEQVRPCLEKAHSISPERFSAEIPKYPKLEGIWNQEQS